MHEAFQHTNDQLRERDNEVLSLRNYKDSLLHELEIKEKEI